jgi:hypothetical protein
MGVEEERVLVVEHVDIETVAMQQATGDGEKDAAVGLHRRPAAGHHQ